MCGAVLVHGETAMIRRMSPDPRQRNAAKKQKKPPVQVRVRPSSDDAHDVVYFRRHPEDDPEETCPGREFLKACPVKVRATMMAVLAQVAAAPPKRFSGGGYWEAMSDDMSGWFEVRVNGPKRHHYRLFCRLDYLAEVLDKPLLVVIDGRSKLFKTELPESEYKAVRSLGDEYLSRNPRSVS